jgi:uncharacterized protein (DUF58 family)
VPEATGRSITIGCVVTAIACLGLVWPVAAWLSLLSLAVWLGLVAADIALLRRPVYLDRADDRVLAHVGDLVRLRYRMQLSTRCTATLTERPHAPLQPWPSHTMRLAAGSHAPDVEATITRRGRHELGDIELVMTGRWGMARIVRLHTKALTVASHPVVGVASTHLARRGSSGSKQSNRVAAAGAFDQLQPYRVGDDARAIDWKRSAATGQLLQKRFTQQRGQPLLLLVDGGRALSGSRFDAAIGALHEVAAASLRGGHSVACALIGRDGVSATLLHRTHLGAVQDLCAQTLAWQPSKIEPNWRVVAHQCQALLQQPSVVVVFTDTIDQAQVEVQLRLSSSWVRHRVVWALPALPLWPATSDEDVRLARATIDHERLAAERALEISGMTVVRATGDLDGHHWASAVLNSLA